MSCKSEAQSYNPSQPRPLSGGIRPQKRMQSPALTLKTSLSLSFLTCKLGIIIELLSDDVIIYIKKAKIISR